LLKLVSKLKYKDFEIEFSRDVAEARAEADQLPPPTGSQLTARPDVSADVLRLLKASPRAAIIEAWREVEEEARHVAIRKEVAVPRPMSGPPSRILNALSAYNIIDAKQLVS
jgi:hypothetical protein